MILSKPEILKEIKSKRLKIEPLKKSHIGPASIDLTLSNEFRIFKETKKPVNLKESSDYKKYTKLIKKSSIILQPDEFILGITKEKITLPDNLCGWLQGRTRFARFGLNVHITASFISPGVTNKQVLEIRNCSKVPLKLNSGTRVCQLILERLEGKAVYNGKYKSQVKL